MTTPYKDKVGWFDYNDSGVAQSHPGAGGWLKVTNDTLGSFTKRGFAPNGVTDVWNPATNQFDWSELSIGDTVDIRFDVSVTTTANNQSIEAQLSFGIGSASPHQLPFFHTIIKASSSHKFVILMSIYIGSLDTLNYPGEIQVNSDSPLPMIVNGWWVRINRR